MTDQTGLAALDLSPAAAPAADVPELMLGSADAEISGNFSAGSETKVAQRQPPALKSAFIHGSRLLWAALLYGAAGLAGWLIAEAAWPTVSALPDLVRTRATQENAERAAFLRTTQKMEEEIRALRTEMESVRSSMQAATPAADAVDTLGKRIDAMKTETNSAIGALSGQVEGLRRDAAAKPAPTGVSSEQAGARSPRNEYVILEQGASRRTTVSATVKVGEGLRRHKIRRGDAFEPARYPDAPGAPRPLGAYGR
ncbi:hypothetical protein F7D13_15710 [Methylocystis rosea]|uniref:M23 family peptidase n=1 Tax=Methylocystis rosea TaxID=173366 RepID=A0ABX6EKP1_9HYPH|nr:hypothetical protein [Methylocystis rosea]QGM95363.1 hypothetical protein F7D13_15710 [Methylocystis rosea]